MTRASYKSLAEAAARQVREVDPWDLPDLLKQRPDTLILDVRERSEFEAAHIKGALNVPRGILEAACEWDYFETEPELVEARKRPVVVVCRSGHRSALAALVMGLVGYEEVFSLKLGIKGWNDSDLPLVDGRGLSVDAEDAQHVLEPRIPREQHDPARRR